MPTDCHVCRLMVEEIHAIMQGEEQELTEEQMKKKKRQQRRKSKAEKARDKSMPMFTAIEGVCDHMLHYSPQSKKKMFRYLKTSVLSDTQTIMTAQTDGDEASEEETREDLINFLCEQRIVGNKSNMACFDEESARSELWKKTFDLVLEKRPDLKDANFDV